MRLPYPVLTRRQARQFAAVRDVETDRARWLTDLLFTGAAVALFAIALVGPPSPQGVQTAAGDRVLTRAVEKAIARHLGMADAGRIHAVSEEAGETLEGDVSERMLRSRAVMGAGQDVGVRRVVNRLEMRRAEDATGALGSPVDTTSSPRTPPPPRARSLVTRG